MPKNDLRRALNYGPTAAARFFLALGAALQALRFCITSVDWAAPDLAVVWASSFAVAAFFAFWRLVDPRPNPFCGWATNSFMCLVWFAGVVVRATFDITTLLTPFTVLALVAVWVLLRTEATPLDTRAT